MVTTTFIEWEGRSWELHHGDPVGEHHAVRQEAGVWDISPLRKWQLRGRNVPRALDRIMTNEMSGLAVGQARYSAFCDSTGHMLGDAVVMNLAPDRSWVFTARDADGSHFRRVLGDAPVIIDDLTEEIACIQLQGPRSRDILRDLCAQSDVTNLQWFRLIPALVEVGGIPCIVARVGYSGELGYELLCAMSDRPWLRHVLAAAGARPYGLAAVETLRIEAGLIRLGQDYAPGATNPYDLSLGRVIRMTKGCFVGREALRGADRGRKLASVMWDGEAVPPTGCSVLDDERVVGRLTSACRSPTFGAGVGLSILDSSVAIPGRMLTIDGGDVLIKARVSTRPLYDPLRLRVRG